MRRKTNDMEITTIEGSSVITCPNLRMGNGHLHSQVTSLKASEHTNTQTDKKKTVNSLMWQRKKKLESED